MGNYYQNSCFMKKIFPYIFVLTLVAQSCKHKETSDSLPAGKIATKEVAVTEYSVISSALPVNIEYEQKDSPAFLKMEIDQSLLDKVIITVKDSTLHLTMKPGITIEKGTKESTIYTNSKTLKLVALTGAGNFDMRGLVKSKRLDIRMEGAGNLDAENIQCETFALTVSGVGNATIKGKAEAASYNLDGVGNIEGYDFATKNMRVFLNGTGNAEINASNNLWIVLNGAGNISYHHKPQKIDSKIEGVGKVEQK